MIFHHDIAFTTNVLGGCLNMRPNAGFELLSAFLVDHISIKRVVEFDEVGQAVRRGRLIVQVATARVCRVSATECKGNRKNPTR